MKVITQERLRGLINKIIDRENTAKDEKDKFIFGVMRVQCAEIIEACQELDTLTVTRLRPMSEAKDNVLILCALTEEKSFLPGRLHGDNFVGMNGFVIGKSEIPGFIPMPRYEPEKV